MTDGARVLPLPRPTRRLPQGGRRPSRSRVDTHGPRLLSYPSSTGSVSRAYPRSTNRVPASRSVHPTRVARAARFSFSRTDAFSFHASPGSLRACAQPSGVAASFLSPPYIAPLAPYSVMQCLSILTSLMTYTSPYRTHHHAFRHVLDCSVYILSHLTHLFLLSLHPCPIVTVIPLPARRLYAPCAPIPSLIPSKFSLSCLSSSVLVSRVVSYICLVVTVAGSPCVSSLLHLFGARLRVAQPGAVEGVLDERGRRVWSGRWWWLGSGGRRARRVGWESGSVGL
ncbi:hypothetical protein BV20DRAFT_974877 [Pilatotrama ljubarskyi]|nr:hypothetical protein BV20DRAFT_974877 [Pilatotrama ljubarskyi]